MDANDIEKTIRELNTCITKPEDRMSEAAIVLMVKLMEATIHTMESATIEAIERGFRAKRAG